MVSENVIRKTRAKFQKASSIGNTRKARGTIHDVNISKSKNWKNGENSKKNFKLKKTKVWVLRNVIMEEDSKSQEATQLEIPKKRGELYNYVNIAKSKNWKTAKIQEIFQNSKN